MSAQATALSHTVPATRPLLNIQEANEIFYRNLEQQIALMQRHLSDILNIAAQGAAFAQRVASHHQEQAAKLTSLARSAAPEKLELEEAVASANMPASEDELARTNLANVVACTKLLMNNAVAAHHNLDTVGEAVLSQAASVILSNAAAAPAPVS